MPRDFRHGPQSPRAGICCGGSSGTPASRLRMYGQPVALLDKKISAPDPAGEVGQVLSSDGQGGYNWVSLPNGSAMAMRIADEKIQ